MTVYYENKKKQEFVLFSEFRRFVAQFCSRFQKKTSQTKLTKISNAMAKQALDDLRSSIL